MTIFSGGKSSLSLLVVKIGLYRDWTDILSTEEEDLPLSSKEEILLVALRDGCVLAVGGLGKFSKCFKSGLMIGMLMVTGAKRGTLLVRMECLVVVVEDDESSSWVSTLVVPEARKGTSSKDMSSSLSKFLTSITFLAGVEVSGLSDSSRSSGDISLEDESRKSISTVRSFLGGISRTGSSGGFTSGSSGSFLDEVLSSTFGSL